MCTEYGNPLSVMGSGDTTDGDGYAEFMLSTKMVFDWVDDAQLVSTLQAYDFTTGAMLCNPCGPYMLERVDNGNWSSSTAIAGIEIECEEQYYHFYLEYRTISTSTPGVVASWAAVVSWVGFSGYGGYTALTDATPGTSSFADAQIAPGSAYTIYLDNNAALQYPVTVKVDAGQDESHVFVTLYSSENIPTTSAPASNPNPMPTIGACQFIVDGAISTDSQTCSGVVYSDEGEDVLVVERTAAVAGTRCCDDLGNGDSICTNACEMVDFATAESYCAQAGSRLCTVAELLDEIPKGTGCE